MSNTSSAPESTVATTYLQDSRFSCNICLEPVTEPVVTKCGHLYCWPCLYRWLEPGMLPGERQSLTGSLYGSAAVDETRRRCPVCNAPCSVPTLVPIYVRNEPPTPISGDVKEAFGQRDVRETQQQQQESSSRILDDETQDTNARTERSDSLHDIDHAPESLTRPADTTESTGLRQRLRFRSRDSVVPSSDSSGELASGSDVPARPAANSPVRRQNSTQSTGESPVMTPRQRGSMVPRTSPGPRVPLSHGLALSFQQALVRATTQPGDPNRQYQQVPPLHRREGHGNAALDSLEEADPNATEFLSRILLILGSFVILCLLLF